ncbi:adenosylmethionine--8-amino-7-oxononanoate transaminase [Elusimicrobiota bacterium]
MANREKINLISEDKHHIWHPFTQMADWIKDIPSAPMIIKAGKGVYLYDSRGKKYIDGISSLWVNLHGHRKKEIDNAIKKQIGKVSHSTFLGLTHEPAIELAEELVQLSPKELSRVFYSDNGSTSVEVALKMAYQYWQQKTKKSDKTMFLSLKNAYHGDTIGSVSVGGMDLFHTKFKSLLFDVCFASSPYCFRCKHRKNECIFDYTKGFKNHCTSLGCKGQCIESVKNLMQKNHKNLAGAVVESMVQGAAGMITMPPGYMKEFEVLCKRYGVLLICDEVATGFGRTGKMLAIEHENIRPDFLCLSKSITGGYLPLAATIVAEKIYSAFLGKYEEYKTFFHGHTYTANPLACAAALANLKIFKRENVLKKLKHKINCLKSQLQNLQNLPNVGNIRQLGFMIGIEIVKNKFSGKGFEPKEKVGAKICALCRPKGLIIRPLGDVLVLMPPLSISNAEITRMIKIVKNSINEYFLK